MVPPLVMVPLVPPPVVSVVFGAQPPIPATATTMTSARLSARLLRIRSDNVEPPSGKRTHVLVHRQFSDRACVIPPRRSNPTRSSRAFSRVTFRSHTHDNFQSYSRCLHKKASAKRTETRTVVQSLCREERRTTSQHAAFEASLTTQKTPATGQAPGHSRDAGLTLLDGTPA